ncbi:unnamed protein product [Peniophora sp. CBMAI 1063]|nr:unnamed protein product [Peniophora sp. CBMAI 1063]
MEGPEAGLRLVPLPVDGIPSPPLVDNEIVNDSPREPLDRKRRPNDKSSPVRPMTCDCSKEGRNLVVCIDGTSNQFGEMNTNVIELYSLVPKDGRGQGDNKQQRTYYNSGIGTYARPSWKSWAWYKQVFGHKVDLAIAWNFERIVLDAYRWLSETYEDGDCIFLFGFSRGAYQVRTLSAMIDKVGLIHRGNEAQIPFAYQLYADLDNGLTAAAASSLQGSISPSDTFKDTFSRRVKVHFVGVWDTVSSIGIVRSRMPLPGTIDGMKHVCYFRHALALDERRIKFLPEYANGGAGPSEPVKIPGRYHHTKEVWFAGTHSDVGGGIEANPTLNRTRPSLRWMFFEASSAGLHLVPFKREFKDEEEITINESLTSGWEYFEHLPFRRLTYNMADAREPCVEWIRFETSAWVFWMLSRILRMLVRPALESNLLVAQLAWMILQSLWLMVEVLWVLLPSTVRTRCEGYVGASSTHEVSDGVTGESGDGVKPAFDAGSMGNQDTTKDRHEAGGYWEEAAKYWLSAEDYREMEARAEARQHALDTLRHSQVATERQEIDGTVSWPPHRGKGRVILDGQKIHPSVWRLKNLGTTDSTYTPIGGGPRLSNPITIDRTDYQIALIAGARAARRKLICDTPWART